MTEMKEKGVKAELPNLDIVLFLYSSLKIKEISKVTMMKRKLSTNGLESTLRQRPKNWMLKLTRNYWIIFLTYL